MTSPIASTPVASYSDNVGFLAIDVPNGFVYASDVAGPRFIERTTDTGAGLTAYIDGTKMSFIGLKQSQDRINVIAYLHTLGSNLPIPAPKPAAAPAASTAAAPAAGAAPAAAPTAPAVGAPTKT